MKRPVLAGLVGLTLLSTPVAHAEPGTISDAGWAYIRMNGQRTCTVLEAYPDNPQLLNAIVIDALGSGVGPEEVKYVIAAITQLYCPRVYRHWQDPSQTVDEPG
jgi:hypothetical protein